MVLPAHELQHYGVDPSRIIDLRQPATARHVPYLDLKHALDRRPMSPQLVIDGDLGPVAYVLDATEEPTPRELASLRRVLAFRDAAPYLALLQPGRLTLYHVALDTLHLEKARLGESRAGAPEARTLLHRLRVEPRAQRGRTLQVQDLIYRLMRRATDALEATGLCTLDALALAGRALFTRFLLDRGVLHDVLPPHIEGALGHWESAFESREAVIETCQWLDHTFNGDFLPVEGLPQWHPNPSAYGVLSDIMYRSLDKQLTLPGTFADLDFAYVPVEVLSQVYEARARPDHRKKRSIYYTPRRLADYMVSEAFANLRALAGEPVPQARVLDPAAGGGVFLVSAFRALAAEHYRAHGSWPDTDTLRQALFDQLVGFDVEPAALTMAALGLYLTAIELDPDPHPVDKLKFATPLAGRVLVDVGHPDPETGATAGSLGAAVDPRYDGAFDLVIGNPPWTSPKRGEGRTERAETLRVIRPIVAARLGDERARAFDLPDKVPDLPFVWRALAWAKPGAQIAFALHGRLLFKTGGRGFAARRDLFEALCVTGILNGAALRKTNVWPNNKAPFCLLFALNERPASDDALYFVSPYLEPGLNREGRVRIDPADGDEVGLVDVRRRPTLFTTLFNGSRWDIRVLDHLAGVGEPLETYWRRLGQSLGQGYKINPPSQPADFLLDPALPTLDTTRGIDEIVVTVGDLPGFTRSRVERTRTRELYRAPMVLCREGPSALERGGRALVSDRDLSFNESYYGLSAARHPDGGRVVRYLALLFHARLFSWHVLTTSAKFSIERPAILFTDVKRFPVRPWEDLSVLERDEVDDHFEALAAGDPDWDAIDGCVARLYGLDPTERDVVAETWLSAAPHHRAAAATRPSSQERGEFCHILTSTCDRYVSEGLAIDELSGFDDSPWIGLALRRRDSHPLDVEPSSIAPLFARADALDVGRLIAVDAERRCLLVGLLRQRRYWTRTRARRLALELLAEHGDILGAVGGRR